MTADHGGDAARRCACADDGLEPVLPDPPDGARTPVHRPRGRPLRQKAGRLVAWMVWTGFAVFLAWRTVWP